jgi:arylsulfatase A-like enzyme
VIFPADVMVDKYLSWADSLFDPQTPYFTVLHFFDPHFQYNPPLPYSTMFSSMSHPGTRWALCPASSMIDAWGRGMISMSDLQRMMDLYDGEIAFLNRQISRLFDGMRRREMLDNTLVMVIADHGEEFADHGGVTHGVQLHREITGIPLIVSGPGVTRGRVETVLAGQVDVCPTLLAYAGLAVPDDLTGFDLLSQDVPVDRILPASGYYADVNDQIVVRDGRMKLFWCTERDSAFMYDLSSDPRELAPLPPDSGLLEEAAFYWSTPPAVNPEPMAGMEDRVEMFRNLGYLR